jgi:hypothetical protein
MYMVQLSRSLSHSIYLFLIYRKESFLCFQLTIKMIRKWSSYFKRETLNVISLSEFGSETRWLLFNICVQCEKSVLCVDVQEGKIRFRSPKPYFESPMFPTKLNLLLECICRKSGTPIKIGVEIQDEVNFSIYVQCEKSFFTHWRVDMQEEKSFRLETQQESMIEVTRDEVNFQHLCAIWEISLDALKCRKKRLR